MLENRNSGVFFTSVGLIVAVSSLWHLRIFTPAPIVTVHVLLDTLLIGGAGLGIIYGGYWHHQYASFDDRFLRLLGWLLAGVLLFTGINTVSLYSGSNQVTQAELLEVVHLAGSIGAVTGLLVGTVEANAIAHSQAAARSAAKANALENERERMYQINELLRHYILNSLMVIRGNIDILSAEDRAERESTIAVIDDRIETIETLIEHIRTLSTALQEETPRTEYELAELVESKLRDVDLPQSAAAEVPDERHHVYATVAFDHALQLLFEALGEALGSDASITATVHGSNTGAVLSITAAQDVAFTADAFSEAGPETDLKFTLASEFLTNTGTLQLGDSTDDPLLCALSLESAT